MIHHIALFVRKPAEAAAFYKKVLEFPEIRRTEDADGLYSVWLRAGACILMIERADAGQAESQGKPAEETLRPVNHALIAFSLSSAEADAFVSRLESSGGRILRRTDFTLYFSDPEGNRLAVSWYGG